MLNRIFFILLGPALILGGWAAGAASVSQTPNPPESLLRCQEDEVRAFWWSGESHSVESCLHRDDINPAIVQYAEEVIGQQGVQK